MSTPIARTLAVACLALAAGSQRSSACTSQSCVCPSADATIDSTPIVAEPLDLAFDFSRYAISRLRGGRMSHVFSLGGPTDLQRLRSRECEAKFLEQLAAREAEIAASLPGSGSALDRKEGAPPTAREPLNVTFDFSGKFQQRYVGRFRIVGDFPRGQLVAEDRQLREEELLGQLASCEQLVIRELAGQSEAINPPARDAAARASDLIDAVAPCDVHAAIVEILERATGTTAPASDVAATARVLDELDDAAYAPWADRPEPSAVDPASDGPTILARCYEPWPLDMTFGYSRHSLEFAGAGEEFRCRCAEAAQLPGHPALNADQVLAELNAAEARIAADLAFPLPAPLPEPGREFRQSFDQQPPNFGWSGMTIAEQSGVAARFRTVTGVAMRFRDEVGFTAGGFSR